MMRRLIAAFAAALLWLAPVAASAQTLIYPSGIGAGVVTNCGTVAVSTPCLNLTQTWNAGGVTFTGILENIIDTASASGSLLMDLQVGSSTRFSVNKAGSVSTSGSIVSGANLRATTNSSLISLGTNSDVVLTWDAANTLALRNGLLPQTLNVYNTYANSGTDYERVVLGATGNDFQISTQKAGNGQTRQLFFGTGNAVQWKVDTSGMFLANTDNTNDIGANGANRPRNIYTAGSITVGPNATVGYSGSSLIWGQTDGVIRLTNNANTSFSLLQFGGTTNSFPALKRNAGAMEVRAADDSGYAGLQALNLFAVGIFATGTVGTQVTTVASLATCNAGAKGYRSFVTDANATTFLSTVAAGGANNVPVVCDGTSWKIG